MNSRNQYLKYVSFIINWHGKELHTDTNLDHAFLIGWQCGFEPLFVAIVDDDETMPTEDLTSVAEEVATEFLISRNWFSAEMDQEADYVSCPGMLRP